MPKISIYEKDLTALRPTGIIDNIVYVPGYAVKGPVNTPTLITNVNRFIEIFGNVPYTFRNEQDWPTGYSDGRYALANTFEKSYIYAIELLNQGLPVLFERVMKEDNVEDWTPTLVLPFTGGGTNDNFILTAKNPGLYYTDMGVTLTEAGNDYLLDIFINSIRVERIRFNFDVNSDNYFVKKESEYIVFPEYDDTLPEELDEQLTEIKFTLNVNTDNDEFIVKDFYDILTGTGTTPSIFEKLIDKDEYDIAFITSGSYPVYELDKPVVITKKPDSTPLYMYQDPQNLTELMYSVAGTRGDIVALIDYNNYTNTGDFNNILEVKSLLDNDTDLHKIQVGRIDRLESAMKYGNITAPWATYNTTLVKKNTILPGSFGYLISFAKSVRNNPNYHAVAGVTRGLVPTLLQVNEKITGAKAQALQEGKISINPITFINPYGYCIWGNRTTHLNDDELVASSFLNVRVLTNNIKKIAYRASKKLSFDVNPEIIWLNFKADVEPQLDNMKSGNGLTKYRLLRKSAVKRATVEAIIRVWAVEATEDFDIGIEVTDSYVNIQ